MNTASTSNAPTAASGFSASRLVERAAPSPADDVRSREKQIRELIEYIDSLPDRDARELLHECLEAVLAFYGDGLARMLQLVGNEGVEAKKILDAFSRDKLVRGLLLIHGLHPLSLEARLAAALDKIRPYLQSHGGNVELVSLQNDVARLRLQGTCQTCPSSSVTLELAVRQVIEDACPDLAGFEVEDVRPQTDAAAPGPCVSP